MYISNVNSASIKLKSIESERVAVKVEAYPGRWTTHIPISSEKDLDAELFSWLHDAYLFASVK